MTSNAPSTKSTQNTPTYHSALHHTFYHHKASYRAREETRSLNLLEAAGYTEFKEMHPAGRNIRVEAAKNGDYQQLIVKPDGQIITGT